MIGAALLLLAAQPGNVFFRLTDVQPLRRDALHRAELQIPIGEREQRAGRAFGQTRFDQRGLDLRRQTQEAELIAEGGLAHGEHRGSLRLRKAPLCEQLQNPSASFKIIQVLAVQVFGEVRGGGRIVLFPEDRGIFCQPSLRQAMSRRSPAIRQYSPPGSARTEMGLSRPLRSIIRASSSSASSSKLRRVWCGLEWMSPVGSSATVWAG